MVDYGAVIADLAERRAAIDQILEGVKRLTAGAAERAPTSAHAPRQLVAAKEVRPRKLRRAGKRGAKVATRLAASSAPKADRAGRPTDKQLALARAIAEKKGLSAAVAATGIKYQTLWFRAKREGWKVAPSPKGVPARKPALSGRSGANPPQPQRCDHCQLVTSKDPCPACGKPLTRAAA
jgi:hypothetical protein